MKKSFSSTPSWRTCLTVFGLWSCPLLSIPNMSAADLPVLSQGHSDLGIAFEDGAWDLHIHDEVRDIEYSPDGAVFQVNASAVNQLPADARFSFLGAAGSSVWVLPQVQDPDVLFLGVGAEEISEGVFVGNNLSVRVLSMEGPGNFFMYSTEGVAGDPQRVVEVRSGQVDFNYDDFRALAGGHAHYNWVFTQPGTYTLGVEVSGILEGSNETIYSPKAYYTFSVVPEPSTGALLLSAVLGAGLMKRRRKA